MKDRARHRVGRHEVLQCKWLDRSFCRRPTDIASGTRFRSASLSAGRRDGRSARAESFFESLDDLLVLGGVARPRAHVGKAELLEKLADVALMIVDAEALDDDALEIDPAPAHDAVDSPVRTCLDDR